MPETIFVDTGFFKALVDGDDDFHEKAVSSWRKFRDKRISLVTSNFIIDETLTVVRVKCNLEKALKFRSLLLKNSHLVKIIRVTVTDEAGAWKWFIKNWSKLSYTDCVSFAVMERLEIKRVATFDKHFQRAGFSLEK